MFKQGLTSRQSPKVVVRGAGIISSGAFRDFIGLGFASLMAMAVGALGVQWLYATESSQPSRSGRAEGEFSLASGGRCSVIGSKEHC